MLLDSEVDLEAPAYESPGFTALVYPHPDPTIPGHLTATVPIHGRYHRPSDPDTREKIELKYPKLLLKSDTCMHGKPLIHAQTSSIPCTMHVFVMYVNGIKWL